jgi:hypothetical protein
LVKSKFEAKKVAERNAEMCHDEPCVKRRQFRQKTRGSEEQTMKVHQVMGEKWESLCIASAKTLALSQEM